MVAVSRAVGKDLKIEPYQEAKMVGSPTAAKHFAEAAATQSPPGSPLMSPTSPDTNDNNSFTTSPNTTTTPSTTTTPTSPPATMALPAPAAAAATVTTPTEPTPTSSTPVASAQVSTPTPAPIESSTPIPVAVVAAAPVAAVEVLSVPAVMTAPSTVVIDTSSQQQQPHDSATVVPVITENIPVVTQPSVAPLAVVDVATPPPTSIVVDVVVTQQHHQQQQEAQANTGVPIIAMNGSSDDPSAIARAWTAHLDTNFGRHYFYNHITKVTTWETPDGFMY
jgi:hypothetical protein